MAITCNGKLQTQYNRVSQQQPALLHTAVLFYYCHQMQGLIQKGPQISVRHGDLRTDELSIDHSLLPWQSLMTLGQQTSYFYKGDK